MSAIAILDAASSFAPLAAALAADGRVKLELHRESDYVRAQSHGMETTISAIGRIVGAIMALGACFAALNSMISALAERRREIATLRAIGFMPTAVVAAVLLEATGVLWASVIGLVGGLLPALNAAREPVVEGLRAT